LLRIFGLSFPQNGHASSSRAIVSGDTGVIGTSSEGSV
jgi:hypothetical protein